MTQFRNRLPLAGLFAVAAVAATSLAASFNAQAHIAEHQLEELHQYQEFIMNMRTPDGQGSCCNLDDAMVQIEERPVYDKPGVSYQVRMVDGLEPFDYPDEGKWINIPTSAVLNGKHAEEVCKTMKQVEGNTCNAPPFNVLWKSLGDFGVVYCYWPKPQTY